MSAGHPTGVWVIPSIPNQHFTFLNINGKFFIEEHAIPYQAIKYQSFFKPDKYIVFKKARITITQFGEGG